MISEWTTGKTFNNIFWNVNNASHREAQAMLPLHSGPWRHNCATSRPRQSCCPSETLQPIWDATLPVFRQLSRILGILNSFVRDPVGMLIEATALVALLLDWWSKICHVKLPVLPTTSLAYCKLLFSLAKGGESILKFLYCLYPKPSCTTTARWIFPWSSAFSDPSRRPSWDPSYSNATTLSYAVGSWGLLLQQ